LIIEWRHKGKPKFVGLLTGAVAGLATITPAAGFVNPMTAMLIGIAAGVVCYLAITFKERMKWDDALDVWGVHGVGGILGVVALGLFAQKSINAAGANGLIFGGVNFFLVEITSVFIVAIYAFAFTYGVLYFIDKFTPVKVRATDEMNGLDECQHGEKAYL
jgi:Amt family ammonium transporter